jgi:hypothetical protein
MSYCRWSSLNWMCDLYCYEDVSGGWTTHVATSRRVREPVPNEDRARADFMADKITAKEMTRIHGEAMDDLRTISLEPIGLAYDGETFNDPTLEAFRDRIVMLADAGYIVPEWLISDIEEEMKGENP